MIADKASVFPRRQLFFSLLALPPLLLLTACPPPVTPDVATAVSDKLAPTIVVTNPLAGQTYAATVHMTGVITDDALTAGDGQGTLRSIDYTLANDVLRKGRLLINPDGTSTVDTKFGSGVIAWNNATHTYSFDISTITPTVLHGLVTVTVAATDANGNVTPMNVQLTEGTGPVISLSSPTGAGLKYAAGTTVLTLAGTVANATDDLTHADNIASISWGVTGKNWGAAITVVNGTTSYTATNTGLFPATSFTFDTSTRAFATSFTIPFISDTTLILTVTATDKNGHSSVSTNYLVADVSGPQLILTSGTTGLYYSPTHYTVPTIAGNVDSSLQTMTLQLTTAGGYTSSVITVYPSNGTGDTGSYSFNLGTGNFQFLMKGTGTSATLSGASGTATVTLTAVNSRASTVASYNIIMDDSPPSVSGVAMASGNANPAYAKAGDTVTLTFQASDALSGLNGLPAVSIAGVGSTVTGPVGSTFTAQRVVLSGNPVDGSGYVPLSITATDNATNPATITAAGTNVTFYDGPPTLSSVSIASNDPGRPTWARSGDTVTLSFTSPRDLAAVPDVTIAGHVVAASPTSLMAHTYTASWTMTGSDTQGPVPFSVNLTDAAGNVGTPVTTTTDASEVTLDRTPPAITAVVFSPSAGWRKIGDTVIATITAGETGLQAGTTMTVNGKAVTGFIDNGNGTYSVTYTVGSGDTDIPLSGSLPISFTLKDPAGNQNAAYTTSPGPGFCPGIDAHVPVIGTVSVSPSVGTLKIGNTITVTIAGGEIGLTQAAAADITVNGVQATSFTDLGTNSYTAQYTISQGDTDRTSLNSVPVHVVLTDAAGNASAASNTTPSSPRIDAHVPVINSVSFTPSSGWRRAGQTVTLTVTLAASETGLTAGAISVNGVPTTSFSGSGVTYTSTYTVGSTDANWTQAQQIPVSAVVTDAAGNSTAPFTTSPAAGLGIDTAIPVISSVSLSPSTGTLKIGDTITVNISAGEAGLTKAALADLTINGVQATSFTDLGSGSYSAQYTIVQGNTDRTSLDSVPVHVVLTDAAGNASAASNTTPASPKIDAHVPVIGTVSVSPSVGTLKIGNTITVTIAGGEIGLTQAAAADITVNGVQATSSSKLIPPATPSDPYRGTITVSSQSVYSLRRSAEEADAKKRKDERDAQAESGFSLLDEADESGSDFDSFDQGLVSESSSDEKAGVAEIESVQRRADKVDRTYDLEYKDGRWVVTSKLDPNTEKSVENAFQRALRLQP